MSIDAIFVPVQDYYISLPNYITEIDYDLIGFINRGVEFGGFVDLRWADIDGQLVAQGVLELPSNVRVGTTATPGFTAVIIPKKTQADIYLYTAYAAYQMTACGWVTQLGIQNGINPHAAFQASGGMYVAGFSNTESLLEIELTTT